MVGADENFAAAEDAAAEVLSALRRQLLSKDASVRIGSLNIPEGMTLELIQSRDITHTWADAMEEQRKAGEAREAAKAAQEERDHAFNETHATVRKLASASGVALSDVKRRDSYGTTEVTMSAKTFIELANELLALRRDVGA